MTSLQRQKSLDKKKWEESQRQGFDMSGCMFYCEKCEYANHTTDFGHCNATQEQRITGRLCDKAYNLLGVKRRR